MNETEDEKRARLERERAERQRERDEIARQRRALQAMMTPAVLARLVEKVGDLMKGCGCPMCGHGARQVLADAAGRPLVVGLPLVPPPPPDPTTQGELAAQLAAAFMPLMGGLPDTRRELLSVLVRCPRCGLMTAHDAATLGLLDLTPPAPPRDAKEPS